MHAAGTKKSQQQDHQKIVQKIEGIYLKFLNVFDPLGSRYCRKLPEIDAKLARLAAKAAMQGAIRNSRIKFEMISTEESEAAPARPWNRLLRSESTWNRGWRGTVSELSIWDLNWSVVETQN